MQYRTIEQMCSDAHSITLRNKIWWKGTPTKQAKVHVEDNHNDILVIVYVKSMLDIW